LNRVVRKPSSPALHSALGQVYLIDKRPEEAEAEFRKALALGSRSPLDRAALGWALVRLGRFEEALPFADEAHKSAHEDFGVHCLYCGLMAWQGRGAEVTELFDFLKRSFVQIQRREPGACRDEPSEHFVFACSEMQSAGFA
jgi:tetratricopeptide (TPR) repeat protein